MLDWKYKLNKLGEIIGEIFVIILGILSFFINKYFTILIIKYLSPVHVIFSIPIIFILEKIVLIIYTIIILIISVIKKEKLEEEIIFKTDNEYKYYKFFLDISGDIVSLIGFLIYLEIITLNCKIFNYNLKKT